MVKLHACTIFVKEVEAIVTDWSWNTTLVYGIKYRLNDECNMEILVSVGHMSILLYSSIFY
jgi:hypothetical protein